MVVVYGCCHQVCCQSFASRKSVKSAPSEAPLHPWVWADESWKCMHVNSAETFQGKMLFLVTDENSKWPDIFPMKSNTVEDNNCCS